MNTEKNTTNNTPASESFTYCIFIYFIVKTLCLNFVKRKKKDVKNLIKLLTVIFSD